MSDSSFAARTRIEHDGFWGFYCSDSTPLTSDIDRSPTMDGGRSITPCCGSSGVTIVVLGASWSVVFVGGLIHTAVGSVSGRGGPFTNRSGWAALALYRSIAASAGRCVCRSCLRRLCLPVLRARDAGGARTAERQHCGHRGAVNMWPHSLHRIQSSASHVCCRIIARGSVSGLPQRVQGAVET
jgi:hypothetical protein